ncbi:phosphoribosylpyrophosphate synthetase [Reichenbachiella sp. MALMAid0571]|uniref:phosphoribosylpyrophosphate synthetase n=1 Tax=Reichenbachiella sp. MALMAid0571 TaxID=3143939 RepID=UPI0032DEC787
MGQQKYYDTVSEATKDLSKRGYTADFKILVEDECLICNKSTTQLSPDEFEIDEVHRFEGETDPADEMIVYAISSTKHDIKGVVINAYGAYADTSTSKIIALLNKH